MPNYPGHGKRNVTIDGRPYSEIKWDRCVCRLAKMADRPLCERCTLLAERGWRVIFAA